MYCPFCGRSANSVVVSILPSKAAPLLRLSSATPHELLIPIVVSYNEGAYNSFECTSNLLRLKVMAESVLLIILT
ncbi:unknown [Coprobacillus sp. CAG:183]|nr:unknown [Coprobacillus sp. CAG:183]